MNTATAFAPPYISFKSPMSGQVKQVGRTSNARPKSKNSSLPIQYFLTRHAVKKYEKSLSDIKPFYIRLNYQTRFVNTSTLSDDVRIFISQHPELVSVIEETIFEFSRNVSQLQPRLEIFEDPNDSHRMLFINLVTHDDNAFEKFFDLQDSFSSKNSSETLKILGLTLSHGI